MNKTNKNYKRSQKGRSMVEMLGVLSVGGISAYSKAVEKHKANEALHKASMMATTVSAFAMTNDGKLPTSITDFANSGYITTLTDNGTQFNLTLSGIDKDVCTQMKNSKGGMVRDVDCDEATSNATITYYKNLATNDEEGKNSPTGPDPACADVTCEDELTCFHGQCKCSDGTFPCGTECCSEGKYCVINGEDNKAYVCVAPTVEEGGCASNDDCDKETEFCQFSGGNCNSPGTVSCKTKVTWTSNSPYTIAGIKVYKSSSQMYWWSAKNLCQAYGKQLVTMADLGISNNGQSYCYFDHSKVADKTYQCNCSGDEGCTQIVSELYTTGINGALWLADNDSHSCRARRVYLNGGIVSTSSRYSNHYALCRDP